VKDGDVGLAPARSRCSDPVALVELLGEHRDVIVPLAIGEPRVLLDAIDAAGPTLDGVRVHQMHALRDRPHLHGAYPGLRHVAYFLSPATRPAFHEGGCDFTPAHFSDMPHVLRHVTRSPIVVAMASPPDRHGWFSLGTNADYVARFIGKAPFFLEANRFMPRTRGENNVHISQVTGWIEADEPLTEVPPPVVSDRDRAIGELIAERVPDGATIQVGIGSIPAAALGALRGHRNLGVHTELLSDCLMELFEAGVVTGAEKVTRPGKMVTTFAMGTTRFYDFLDDNAAVEFLPVDWVNDLRVIGRERAFVSINATLEVDLLGQANSEMLAGRMWSGSGGQADFAKGAMFSEHGRGFLALHSTTSDGSLSRIKVRLGEGAVVTTNKNTVDCVVTEYGVAELHGEPLSIRAQRLIAIAHPKFRDELTAEAKEAGFLR
jgi:acyl-CoA hydrolase